MRLRSYVGLSSLATLLIAALSACSSDSRRDQNYGTDAAIGYRGPAGGPIDPASLNGGASGSAGGGASGSAGGGASGSAGGASGSAGGGAGTSSATDAGQDNDGSADALAGAQTGTTPPDAAGF